MPLHDMYQSGVQSNHKTDQKCCQKIGIGKFLKRKLIQEKRNLHRFYDPS